MGYGACRTPPYEREPDVVYYLDDGDAGVLSTIDKMRTAANDAQYHAPTVLLARAIVLPWARRGDAAQLDAIYHWLKPRYVYVRDPIGPERVEHPADLLQEVRTTGIFAGDCDCLATLVATLGQCIGFPARFVTVGLGRGRRLPFQHVWCELLEESPRECWTAIDLAAPRELAGWIPSRGLGRVQFHEV